METFAIHVCVWYTPVERDWGRTLLNYWPISIPSKIFCNNSPENICFSVLADQNDKKMAVIFCLYVWGQWIVTGYQCRDQPIRSCFSWPIRGCSTTFFIAGALPGTRDSEGIVERKHKDGLQESLREHGHHEVSCWAVRGKIWTAIRGT